MYLLSSVPTILNGERERERRRVKKSDGEKYVADQNSKSVDKNRNHAPGRES